MATTLNKPKSPPPAAAPSPGPRRVVRPLENGDKLTRAEFERRYRSMSGVKKAELIEGIVHMPSPVRLHEHGKPHNHLGYWVSHYEASTPGIESGNNATIRLDADNELQPDVLLRISPSAGGQSRDSAEGYVEGAPELIAEISSSSASYDLRAKKDVFRRNGVSEYMVWLVEDRELHWWRLEEGAYVPLEQEDGGILKSRVFPGLWLDAAALLAGELSKVRETLEKGLASPEHGEFQKRLGGAKS
jgi:Uma2 family endonuclease